jgi:hypothetical protein
VALTPAADDSRLRHDGVGQGPTARVWRTVTPAALQDPIAGPLVIGDGRFLGLGLMAPVRFHEFAAREEVNGAYAESSSLREKARA